MPTLSRRELVSGTCGAMASALLSPLAVVPFSEGVAAAIVKSARGRVSVRNNAVYTDRNTVLRGSTMTIGGMYWTSTGNSQNPSYWQGVRNLGLNAVRLDVKVSDAGRTLSQQLPLLDDAVDLAQQNDMYVVILSSVQPGRYHLSELRAFWSSVANRYKNRTHVLYEMVNEPVSWWPRNYSMSHIMDLKSVYSIMRAAAPQTHIIIFTFPNLIPDSASSIVSKIALMSGIDYTKSSVGFHHYCGGRNYNESTYEATVRSVKDRYPVLMTETSYWIEPENIVVKNALEIEERLGIGWFSLDGKNNVNRLKYEILPSLRAAGFNWPMKG